MAKAFFLLTCYHFLLFRHVYFQNPYHWARGEALEQGYASFLHLGRERRAGRFVPYDPYYYPHFAAVPFLSSFYPPYAVAAWLATFLTLDQAWILYALTMGFHFWYASVSVYILVTSMGLAPLVAGFASVTFSSLGYSMKHNSSIVYTLAWIPPLLLLAKQHVALGYGLSVGMMLLAGYWPIGLLAIPISWFCWVGWL